MFADTGITRLNDRKVRVTDVGSAAELEEKTHETVLTIDFKKLNENLSFYRKLIPKKTKLLCMI